MNIKLETSFKSGSALSLKGWRMEHTKEATAAEPELEIS